MERFQGIPLTGIKICAGKCINTSGNILQTLAQVVKNLYHTERLVPYLYGIGQRHCRFADRGFKHEYWDMFLDALEHSLSEHMSKLPDFDEKAKAEAVRVSIKKFLALFLPSFRDKLKYMN